MRKLALDDEILLSIEKPARYIGNEVNSIMKNKNEVDIRFAMCFPDVYEIGMSHLGIQILYDMFNRRDDVWCERVYSPWTDLDTIMRKEGIPLFALESQDPIREFDFLGITIQFEMCYTNILQILELSQIPLHSCDRAENDPIVIGGGPCVYNPEPLAEFFDLFYIGEGETVYDELLDTYKKCRAEGSTRTEFLEQAARIEGIYVPSFYDAEYNEDGTLRSFIPNNVCAPASVKKQVVMDVTDTVYPMKPVVPFIKATQDRVVLEIQRGCTRGCRFCQAGMIYRPTRGRNVKRLKEYAKTMLTNTGHEEISLSSLSSSDYSDLKELVMFLIDEFKEKELLTERDLQDYLGRYQDLRDEWKRKRESGELSDITDDVVFEVELINQVEINIDYILMLVKKYHDTNCEDKEILISIKKAVDASPELRSKKELIDAFIREINDIDDIMIEWHDYVVEIREQELITIIEEERLKENETRKFLENAFREGAVKTVGTDIDRIMPPVSRFGGGNRAVKKKTVIDRLKAYFDKFYGIGGKVKFTKEGEES